MRADLKRWDEIDRLVNEIIEEVGPIDVLVNNAGEMGLSLTPATDEALWLSMVALNLGSVLHCTQKVASSMRSRRSGRIVMIGSSAGTVGGIGQAAYAATKSGLIGMCRSFARELAPFGITVNVVAPGFIQTSADAGPAISDKRIANLVLLRRLGRAEEVAGLVDYLCSSDAGYITGQVLHVDGGLALA